MFHIANLKYLEYSGSFHETQLEYLLNSVNRLVILKVPA